MTRLAAAWVLGAVVGCSAPDPATLNGTAVFLTCRFNPADHVRSLRFAGSNASGADVFAPDSRPQPSSAVDLDSPKSERILLPDALAGTTITLSVTARNEQGQVVETGSLEVTPVAGRELYLDVTLSPSAQDGGGDDAGGSDAGGTDAGGADAGGADAGNPDAGPAGCSTELCLLASYATREFWRGVYGGAANDVWIGGAKGVLYRWNGSALSNYSPSPTQYELHLVAGSSTSDVLTAGFTAPELYRYDGGEWGVEYFDGGGTIMGAWASSPTNAFLTCDESLYRKTTGNWERVAAIPSDGGSQDYFRGGVSEGPTGTLWMAANHALFRWQGGLFFEPQTYTLAAGRFFNSIHANASGDVWAVGEQGLVIHRLSANGWEQKVVNLPSLANEDFEAVWVQPAGDVWIGGFHGALVHYRPDAGFTNFTSRSFDGGTAATQGESTVDWLRLFGVGDELWAVGGKNYIGNAEWDAGAISHFRVGP